jgi:hypothetical protein
MKGHFGFRVTATAIIRSGLLCGLFACTAVVAAGQAVRMQQKALRPRPDLGCVLCTLTVSATPSTVNFTLVKGGIATGSAPVVITTTMSGVTLLSSLKLYGYFSSATSALADGRPTPDKIPSSAVFGQMTTGVPTTYTAFTQTNTLGTAGAGLLLFNTSSLLSLGCIPSTASCRTDSLNLRIDLTSLPLQPAGSYSGTLTLQAQAL